MAELERSEHGDSGRARGWMLRAVRARTIRRTADGYVSDLWRPVSPVTDGSMRSSGRRRWRRCPRTRAHRRGLAVRGSDAGVAAPGPGRGLCRRANRRSRSRWPRSRQRLRRTIRRLRRPSKRRRHRCFVPGRTPPATAHPRFPLSFPSCARRTIPASTMSRQATNSPSPRTGAASGRRLARLPVPPRRVSAIQPDPARFAAISRFPDQPNLRVLAKPRAARYQVRERFLSHAGHAAWSAAIAQLVEHVIRNDGVGGWSPSSAPVKLTKNSDFLDRAWRRAVISSERRTTARVLNCVEARRRRWRDFAERPGEVEDDGYRLREIILRGQKEATHEVLDFPFVVLP